MKTLIACDGTCTVVDVASATLTAVGNHVQIRGKSSALFDNKEFWVFLALTPGSELCVQTGAIIRPAESHSEAQCVSGSPQQPAVDSPQSAAGTPELTHASGLRDESAVLGDAWAEAEAWANDAPPGASREIYIRRFDDSVTTRLTEIISGEETHFIGRAHSAPLACCRALAKALVAEQQHREVTP